MTNSTHKKLKLTHEDCGFQKVEGAPTPGPLERPPFTLKEIRDVIPPHCFDRCLVTSSCYLIQNLFLCAGLFYFACFIPNLNIYYQFILWPLYWIFQVIYMAGLWVIAHDCGHGAFSKYDVINDTIGWLLHSSLLVPYQNWKISHHKHHQNAAHCDHDEVFIPPPRSLVQSETVEFLEDSPFYNIVVTLLIFLSWMPGYLVYNISGPPKNRQNPSHFSPTNPIFSAKQRSQILMGNFGFILGLSLLLNLSVTFGFKNIYLIYIIPYWGLNFFLIFVTFLHHTDTMVPHYRGQDWSWMRGALSTVDRSFGNFLDDAVHHISDTHVIHHLFSNLPFYHAVEATHHAKKVLGDYYLRDETPVHKAFLRLLKNCRFVEDEGGIVFYKKSLKN